MASLLDSYVGLMLFGTRAKIAEIKLKADVNMQMSNLRIRKLSVNASSQFFIKPHARLIIAVSSPTTPIFTPPLTPRVELYTPRGPFLPPRTYKKLRKLRKERFFTPRSRYFTTPTISPRERYFWSTYSFIDKFSKRHNTQTDVRPKHRFGDINTYKEMQEFDKLITVPRVFHQRFTNEQLNGVYKVGNICSYLL